MNHTETKWTPDHTYMTDHFPDSEQTIKTKNGGVKLVLWTQTLSWQNDAVMQIISTCENYTNNNIQNG